MSIGQRIKIARSKAVLSQKELAEKLGVSASMIGQYESDIRRPKFETIQKIANALGVSPLYLMEGNAEDAYPGIFRVPHTVAIDTDKINKEFGITIVMV